MQNKKISVDMTLLALLKRVHKCVLNFSKNHAIQISCIRIITAMNKTQNLQKPISGFILIAKISIHTEGFLPLVKSPDDA